MEGLTYETKSQAETAVSDYSNQGLMAEIKRVRGGYRVLLKPGLRELEEPEIEAMELGAEMEETAEEIAMEQKAEAREERGRRTPRAIGQKSLQARHKELDRQNAELAKRGEETGAIVEVRDPETLEVIDYELKFRTGKTLREAGKELGVGSPEQLATVRKIGGMKGRLKQQALATTQRMPMPNANIAWLPERDERYIGARRPAIGNMGTVDLGKIGIPTIRTNREEVLGQNPLKVTPRTGKMRIVRRTEEE